MKDVFLVFAVLCLIAAFVFTGIMLMAHANEIVETAFGTIKSLRFMNGGFGGLDKTQITFTNGRTFIVRGFLQGYGEGNEICLEKTRDGEWRVRQ